MTKSPTKREMARRIAASLYDVPLHTIPGDHPDVVRLMRRTAEDLGSLYGLAVKIGNQHGSWPRSRSWTGTHSRHQSG